MPARRLAGPAALTGVAATKYTTPAAIRTIVRHIHVSNTGVGAIAFTLSIGVDAAGTRIFDAISIAAGAVLDHYCYYVLTAAEVIQAFGGVAGVLTIDGDEEAA